MYLCNVLAIRPVCALQALEVADGKQCTAGSTRQRLFCLYTAHTSSQNGHHCGGNMLPQLMLEM